ncbi:TatD family hydrolase [Chloroflexota bacterium]
MSNLSIIDTHAHLGAKDFKEDLTEVIIRALQASVSTIITVGVDLESNQAAINLAEKYPEVLAAVGFHPHQANTVKETDVDKLAKFVDHPKVVAIGEAGLDFYRNYSSRDVQLQVLKWQLKLAIGLEVPVIIHCRQAETELLSLLSDCIRHHKNPSIRYQGVIHCFMGNTNTAQQYLDMGFHLSFGAYIGYPNASNMHAVIKGIPQDRLLVETDCPFLPPQVQRGQRNEPAYLPLTVALLAEIREVSFDTISRETTQNALRLFGGTVR